MVGIMNVKVVEKLKFLKGKKALIIESVMNAIIPGGGAFDAGASDYNLLPTLDHFFRAFDIYTRFLIFLILYYLEYWAFFHTGKVLTKLTTDQASHYLHKMETSSFYHNRSAVMVFKLLTTMPFFNIDEVTAQIGYYHGCHLNGTIQQG